MFNTPETILESDEYSFSQGSDHFCSSTVPCSATSFANRPLIYISDKAMDIMLASYFNLNRAHGQQSRYLITYLGRYRVRPHPHYLSRKSNLYVKLLVFVMICIKRNQSCHVAFRDLTDPPPFQRIRKIRKIHFAARKEMPRRYNLKLIISIRCHERGIRRYVPFSQIFDSYFSALLGFCKVAFII